MKSFLPSLGLLVALYGCSQSGPKPPTPASTTTLKPTPPVASADGLFRDVYASSGIQFTLSHNGRSPLTILETLGTGCAIADFDNDGWPDILLLGPNRVTLYHNNHDMTFTDITEGSGLKQQGEWQGCAVGDYDNDGKLDLYLSGYRTCALYHNLGRSRPPTPNSGGDGSQKGGGGQTDRSAPTPLFEDVTQKAGLKSNFWGASACFLDIDNDGHLDLYVTNYVKFYPNSHKYCKYNGIESTCGPTNYDPEKGRLYHNTGNGTFVDETVKRGLADAHGNALGVAIADYDGDGWIDFAVANDQLPGDMYHNKGKGFFENVGLMTGTAYDVSGTAHAGMGIDWADVIGNGKLGMVVTTYQHQPTSLYLQTGPSMFTDACHTAGIGQATINNVGFGVKFLDYDNDGLPDIVIANGHAVDNVAKSDSTTTYRQLPQLFHNLGNGKYEETSTKAGAGFQNPIVGRGLAVGDLDNDGKLDIVIVDIEGHLLVLHNEDKTPNHWLKLRLQGTKSNRDGIGAHVWTTVGGKTWQQVVTTTGSFMSASDIRPQIGLGSATKADKIEIRWPSGKKTVLKDVAGDSIVDVRE